MNRMKELKQSMVNKLVLLEYIILILGVVTGLPLFVMWRVAIFKDYRVIYHFFKEIPLGLFSINKNLSRLLKSEFKQSAIY